MDTDHRIHPGDMAAAVKEALVRSCAELCQSKFSHETPRVFTLMQTELYKRYNQRAAGAGRRGGSALFAWSSWTGSFGSRKPWGETAADAPATPQIKIKIIVGSNRKTDKKVKVAQMHGTDLNFPQQTSGAKASRASSAGRRSWVCRCTVLTDKASALLRHCVFWWIHHPNALDLLSQRACFKSNRGCKSGKAAAQIPEKMRL